MEIYVDKKIITWQREVFQIEENQLEDFKKAVQENNYDKKFEVLSCDILHEFTEFVDNTTSNDVDLSHFLEVYAEGECFMDTSNI